MKHLPFRIFTLAILIILVVPMLVQDGMFLDGVLYAAVAKNQAENFGSFWFPIFSETWNKHGVHTFHEHPPLVFGIQSLFYKILGTSIYVDRFYTFLMALLTAWLIHLNWKTLFFQQKKYINFSWLPILLWIIIPICFWSFQQNMLENTMGVFTLASTYFLLKFYFQKPKTQYLLWSSLFIFLASFSKGVPGFFPLAFPFLFWISHRKIKFVNVLHHTSLLTFGAASIYVTLLLHEPAKESLTFYFENRLMGRIGGAHTVGNRFYISIRLIQELLPPLILGSLIFLFLKFKKTKLLFEKNEKQHTVLFFLLGLAGTFPLMLTMVQKGFYMVHALPFFGIAIALLILPSFSFFYNNTNTGSIFLQNFKYFSIVLLLSGIIFSAFQIGKTKRDSDMLQDVYLLKKTLPPKTHLSLEKTLGKDWSLMVYLMRNANITSHREIIQSYFLVEKKKKGFQKDGFSKQEIGLIRYDLWVKNETEGLENNGR